MRILTIKRVYGIEETSERSGRENRRISFEIARVTYPRCANPIVTLLHYTHYVSKLMKL